MSSPKQEAKETTAKRLCVLKFGSSVLEREGDYPKVVHEIYRTCAMAKVVPAFPALAVTRTLYCRKLGASVATRTDAWGA